LRRAAEDAKNLKDGGVDGILVENYSDVPFKPTRVDPQTIVTIGLAVKDVANVTGLPVGVNVLRNDAMSAVAIACVTGARFVRVNVYTEAMLTDQGIINPCAHEVLRYRKSLGADVRIFADVHVKHAAPLISRPIEEVARDSVERAMADVLVLTGTRTGIQPDIENFVKVKKAVPTTPILAGSGVNETNLAEILRFSHGAIVGTSLKIDGVTTNPVDIDRVRALMRAARNRAEPPERRENWV
jgi:hypothetical protein